MSKRILSIRIVLCLALLCATHLTVFADPFGFTDPGLDDAEGAPVDGGLSLLVAGGIAYGVKRARDMRKKGKDQ